ncbi:RNA polymerase sigma factor [Coprobacter fastidiosus]|jgi:RNA polymerase sigma-70 factor (ECF subfamily)|uniref:RNA polymerase sigma factor n=1 Tax=Coprobacter fastidiosus TaxID=1099853 RepID=UPI00241D4A40|nr:sigma-70 family RNA polymerase sigma factor [Coprobacter fastidiosus]
MREEELVEHCKQKDKSAQKQLYELYAGALFALCIRYSGNREAAEDILHDGFLRIFTSFDKFDYRGEGSLKAWLSRIMVNTALEYIRKDGEMNRVLTLNEVPDIIDPESEDEDLEKIPQSVLMKFVSELPSGYRTVFNLYTFEEKSHKEIAALLGINEKSSSSQLFRARAILAKRIKMYLTKAGI